MDMELNRNLMILRVRLARERGALGRVMTVLGDSDVHVASMDLVEASADHLIRDIVISVETDAQAEAVAKDLTAKLAGQVDVLSILDRVLAIHQGGKLQVASRVALENHRDLSRVYTPGVGKVCMEIARNPATARQYTMIPNTVGVITDGTAVLGLGDIGPVAGMPVMEGKALLFKRFSNLDAFPILLATKDVEQIVETITNIAPTFGGLNLEDISAPRCFEIEERLRKTLTIPVFHDDQHGTAVVVMAGLINALKAVGRAWKDTSIVINGAGASGTAVARMLSAMNPKSIVMVDTQGVIGPDRYDKLNKAKRELLKFTNPDGETGGLVDAMKGKDVFVGLSGPDLVNRRMVESMNESPIVFAMANPEPEIRPELIQDLCSVTATGRSDYPNQINNVLAFPGILRGAIDVQARDITDAMKIAAAQAIATAIPDDEISEDYIIPGVFHPGLAYRVAEAVAQCARDTGVALHPEAKVRHPDDVPLT